MVSSPGNEVADQNLHEEDIHSEVTLDLRVEADGQRIDLFISRLPDISISRTHAQRLISAGAVTLNEAPVKQSRKVHAGEILKIVFPPLETEDVLPEALPISVIYEDNDLIVVNKQKSMVVHPAPHLSSGTLVNALLHHCGDSLSGINGVLRPGIVHRLDKDTSGLIIVAKNDAAHTEIANQIKERTIVKKYTAVLHGRVVKDKGTIKTLIARNPKDRKKMAVTDKYGKEAITEYFVSERFSRFTVIDITLHTGRTHQIRVHAAHIGHPVAGDPVYGGMKMRGDNLPVAVRQHYQTALAGLKGQALHSREITFKHPKSGKVMAFTVPLPPDISEFLDFLRRGINDEI